MSRRLVRRIEKQMKIKILSTTVFCSMKHTRWRHKNRWLQWFLLPYEYMPYRFMNKRQKSKLSSKSACYKASHVSAENNLVTLEITFLSNTLKNACVFIHTVLFCEKKLSRAYSFYCKAATIKLPIYSDTLTTRQVCGDYLLELISAKSFI